jgi:hypothetical protein
VKAAFFHPNLSLYAMLPQQAVKQYAPVLVHQVSISVVMSQETVPGKQLAAPNSTGIQHMYAAANWIKPFRYTWTKHSVM